MTISELIRALEIYDSEKEVKLNDFHKGLDDIGVIREVAEGHVEIIRMGYGKEYFEKPLPTDEEIVKEANEIGEKESWPIGRQTGFIFGAKWIRNLMRKEASEVKKLNIPAVIKLVCPKCGSDRWIKEGEYCECTECMTLFKQTVL